MGGFVVALGGFGYSVFLTYLELFVIEAICQWCVASAVLMTILFAAQRDPDGRLRRDAERRSAARRRDEREPSGAEQLAAAAPARAVFLAIVGVAVLIVVSQSQSERRRRQQPRGRRRGRTSELGGIPQNGMVLGDPKAPVDPGRVRRPPVPGLQGLRGRNPAADDRIAGARTARRRSSSATSRSSARIGSRRRRGARRRRTGPRLELRRALLPQPGRRERAATSTDEFLDRGRRRRPASRTSRSWNRNAGAQPCSRRGRSDDRRSRSSSASTARRRSRSKARGPTGLEAARHARHRAGDLEEAIEEAA